MGENQTKKIKISNGTTELKKMANREIKKTSDGKRFVAFATLGCRVNHYETEAMAEKFIQEGYEVTDFENFADVYVINTCSVTNMSDKKSRQIISRARRRNQEAIIAAVGCYSQVAPEEVAKIEGVDVVLGTRNKGDIVYYINKAKDEQKSQLMVGEVLKNKQFEELNIEEYQDKTRAFLKIQDGCNRFCAYCVIPYTRGATCSKDPEKVLNEIKNLSQHGFKEIILSGIHTASYGVDLDGNITLITLLEEIEKLEGIERVRIGSIEPSFFTDEVIGKIKDMKKLCPQFHLSLQSGCDATLKRMNRRYTAKEYEDAVNKIRENLKDASITTDVIVGFPGETDEEFNETYEFLKRLKLTKTHIFKFSPRKGTKAADMTNQIDGTVKDKRSKTLIELNDKNEGDFSKSLIGRELDVLLEQEVTNKKDVFEGYTRNYVKVEIPNVDANMIGKIITCKIEEANGEYVVGKLI
ncbi:tRNA (N(6)-L-threonylcarbamoyladenosine(37)-C(2))-methylthiotransferase MtaB [Clostridium saccharoperbutylacetonicum]|uniref:Threonylcarbamoyladenosine tRNA methylthiotransferase MtaB n=1 Tax=Clostridium saccharoperbutylacetonicum N1-4(HMT) TaxID=931276 RepID=M1LPD5_9CLOT|nr:tRNA (N(6)-L-threonylcarbamoyladenosine(37)-C(2))-methylthiotransferase MtaB [Clostridium saccharoperbutylacetonicum]AGF54700.1 threonylcarbamoyladenosine tRNA methylthiotransferase MtaB [Clostridium saccharoperbutylacetonicum N1-4(HMT)]AQR93655.1 threonylcarbamoyladenosine tRNA methylthiotransferase MtaB [Clostridium saccharoperbutylacetonicum]NRT58779.1 threonylcarbamoyladenosine tRNA methylthiotransferase MtaB [Clostridium saccharoperbutylacetonicum]NSB27968.1 threonylcarbamoyladenosine t